jgi:hypothetical protein
MADGMTPADMILMDPSNPDSTSRMQALTKQLGASSADQEKLDAIRRQSALSAYLRGGPDIPHGQYIPGYHGIGTYVRPNALQYLGAGLHYANAAQQGQAAIDKEQAMAEHEAQNRTAIMSLILEAEKAKQAQGMGARPTDPTFQAPTDLSSFAAPNIDPYTGQPKQRAQPRQMSPDEFDALQYSPPAQ